MLLRLYTNLRNAQERHYYHIQLGTTVRHNSRSHTVSRSINNMSIDIQYIMYIDRDTVCHSRYCMSIDTSQSTHMVTLVCMLIDILYVDRHIYMSIEMLYVDRLLCLTDITEAALLYSWTKSENTAVGSSIPRVTCETSQVLLAVVWCFSRGSPVFAPPND